MSEANEGFKPIESQEELDGIIKERLKRERETSAKRYEGWVSPEDHQRAIGEANQACDEYKKAHEGDEQTIADLRAENQRYATAALKSRIAREGGLSYDWVSRIGGDDEQSIRADAEALKKLVGSNSNLLPTKKSEPTGSDNKTTQGLKELLGSIKTD